MRRHILPARARGDQASARERMTGHRGAGGGAFVRRFLQPLAQQEIGRWRAARGLDGSQQEENIEDRRGESGGFGGGGFGLPMGGGLGIGTIVILGLVGWALGVDPRGLIGGAEMLSGGHAAPEQ